MLADGFSTRVGRRAAYLHRDRINGRLRGRKGARLTAITNGGVIPDRFDYDVLLMPKDVHIGTLNEDFAFESLAGDIFQLGNTSYRILRIQSGWVLVEDAKGQPPNIPFWFGEAPGRNALLSVGVSDLRAGLAERLEASGDQARTWLLDTYGLEPADRPIAGLLRGRPGRPGPAAHPGPDRPGMLLRCGRRHAPGGAFDLRLPPQPRLGVGPA